jgi:hypothetical protein
MTTVDDPTLEQVLGLARRLPPAEQARLVAQLTPTIAAALADAARHDRPMADPWATLARLREELRALGPVSPSVTEELIASRR